MLKRTLRFALKFHCNMCATVPPRTQKNVSNKSAIVAVDLVYVLVCKHTEITCSTDV